MFKKKYRTFQDPNTNKIIKVKVGYSWSVFFCGIIPMLFRKDWVSAFVSFCIAFTLIESIPTILGVSPVVYFYAMVAYYYNDYYADKLLKKGYIPLD